MVNQINKILDIDTYDFSNEPTFEKFIASAAHKYYHRLRKDFADGNPPPNYIFEHHRLYTIIHDMTNSFRNLRIRSIGTNIRFDANNVMNYIRHSVIYSTGYRLWWSSQITNPIDDKPIDTEIEFIDNTLKFVGFFIHKCWINKNKIPQFLEYHNTFHEMVENETPIGHQSWESFYKEVMVEFVNKLQHSLFINYAAA